MLCLSAVWLRDGRGQLPRRRHLRRGQECPPFLAMPRASGAAVGIIAGLGEFVGYGIRLGSGYLADRTRRYRAIAILGCTLNLLTVPALLTPVVVSRYRVAGDLPVSSRPMAIPVLIRVGRAGTSRPGSA